MATSGLWRTKSIEQSIADTDDPQTRLRRNLGALDLTVFGVAVSIGAGIFVLAAQQAGDTAGPAVSLSFVLAAIACGFAVLCYAEPASTVPVAGSAYTYSYATFGEFIVWIIGCVAVGQSSRCCRCCPARRAARMECSGCWRQHQWCSLLSSVRCGGHPRRGGPQSAA